MAISAAHLTGGFIKLAARQLNRLPSGLEILLLFVGHHGRLSKLLLNVHEFELSPVELFGLPWAGSGVRIDCDLICMSVGYSPAAHLLHHAGTKFAYDAASHMYRPDSLPPHVFAAGSVNQAYALDATLSDGMRAGWMAARDAGFSATRQPAAPTDLGCDGVTHPWPIFPHDKGMDFVDFDEDLKYKDLINGIADGFDNVELLKRYSTVGMGPSQGKHSAVAAVRIVARETGESLHRMSVTTQRPPYTPEKFGHMAGRVFEPERRTAMHHRHLELGAQMMPAGLWWRPAYYGKKSERDRAIRDERL